MSACPYLTTRVSTVETSDSYKSFFKTFSLNNSNVLNESSRLAREGFHVKIVSSLKSDIFDVAGNRVSFVWIFRKKIIRTRNESFSFSPLTQLFGVGHLDPTNLRLIRPPTSFPHITLNRGQALFGVPLGSTLNSITVLPNEDSHDSCS